MVEKINNVLFWSERKLITQALSLPMASIYSRILTTVGLISLK